MTRIKITKLEAARRQLHTAIGLWFNEGDPVSIHTLAYSAYQVVHDLNRKKKGPPLIFDSPYVKNEYRKWFVGQIKEAANFFKHADLRGSQTTSLDFEPHTSEGFMLWSLKGLLFLGQTPNDFERAFFYWSLIHRPYILSAMGKEMVSNALPIDELNELRTVNRKDFLHAFLEVTRLNN